MVWYLVQSATHPTPHNTLWSQDLFIHKPFKLPGEHTAQLSFLVHRTIFKHKSSLSYTRYPLGPESKECTCGQSVLPI